tara:strand:+ start:190 stop:504 length:315 start_codon:yes stop_codon:yes gene_type:complete
LVEVDGMKNPNWERDLLKRFEAHEDFEVFDSDIEQSNLPPNLARDTDYQPLIILSATEYPWLETHSKAHYIRTTEEAEGDCPPGVKLYAYPLDEWMKFMAGEEE